MNLSKAAQVIKLPAVPPKDPVMIQKGQAETQDQCEMPQGVSFQGLLEAFWSQALPLHVVLGYTRLSRLKLCGFRGKPAESGRAATKNSAGLLKTQ